MRTPEEVAEMYKKIEEELPLSGATYDTRVKVWAELVCATIQSQDRGDYNELFRFKTF